MDAIEPNAQSLCRDCFFFADGACPRFLAAADNHGTSLEETVVVACGGYETVNPPHES